MTQESITRKGWTVTIVALLLLSSTSVAGTVAAESSLVVEQEPIEFRALESGDNHVEVIFSESINTEEYEFTVLDSNGQAVAGDDDINRGLTEESVGRVVIDLGARDLSGDAVLRIKGETVDRELPIVTTASFVQEGYDVDNQIQLGDRLALVDIWDADTYYEIRTEDGDLVTNGTLGTESYVTAIDTQDWDENVTYTVQFGDESSVREVAVLPDDNNQPDNESSTSTEDSNNESSTSTEDSNNESSTSTEDSNNESSTSTEDSAPAKPGPTAELEIHNLTLSETDITIDQSITVVATFENTGNDSGQFVAWVANGGLDRLSHRTVPSMTVDERRKVRITVTFERPGTYTLLLSGRMVGTVTVRDPTRERFNDRYPALDYRSWQSFLKSENAPKETATSEEES